MSLHSNPKLAHVSLHEEMISDLLMSEMWTGVPLFGPEVFGIIHIISIVKIPCLGFVHVVVILEWKRESRKQSICSGCRGIRRTLKFLNTIHQSSRHFVIILVLYSTNYMSPMAYYPYLRHINILRLIDVR
jgi:hypothetical protein